MSWKWCLLVFFVSSSASDDVSQRLKRADIDLQTCIDNFDIHRDKIIRTQDSQNMGAKYLNEIDLGSREECLRLCCETDNCDVFVFEEKNSGSCYLFHCGPPEDFKCKFTHHVNYSSAVLAINRHLPDLESQIKLTKHEQDLSKLRKPEVEVEPKTPPPSTTVQSKEIVPEIRTKRPQEQERKCSRYQFECRSTSECIAIYNACDGIPQCADGSDEAPELGCPESTTSPPAPARPVPPPPPPPIKYDNIPPQRIHPLSPAQLEMSHPPLPPEQPRQDFVRPVQKIRQFDSVPPQYGPLPPPNPWVPHQSNLMPSQYDQNSHIFNHKGAGLQVPDGQEISQPQYSDAGGNEQYPPNLPSYYRQENWQDFNRFAPEIPPKNNDFQATTPEVNPKHEQEKMAHELKHSKEKMDHEPKIKIEKHFPEVVAYKIDGDLQDGVAETPGGAVLSLTLGLIITCIMALLIVCRLRVRRRMRKGGKSYAHDADYLVNGMYL